MQEVYFIENEIISFKDFDKVIFNLAHKYGREIITRVAFPKDDLEDGSMLALNIESEYYIEIAKHYVGKNDLIVISENYTEKELKDKLGEDIYVAKDLDDFAHKILKVERKKDFKQYYKKAKDLIMTPTNVVKRFFISLTIIGFWTYIFSLDAFYNLDVKQVQSYVFGFSLLGIMFISIISLILSIIFRLFGRNKNYLASMSFKLGMLAGVFTLNWKYGIIILMLGILYLFLMRNEKLSLYEQFKRYGLK